jgi:hypothetical protein
VLVQTGQGLRLCSAWACARCDGGGRRDQEAGPSCEVSTRGGQRTGHAYTAADGAPPARQGAPPPPAYTHVKVANRTDSGGSSVKSSANRVPL